VALVGASGDPSKLGYGIMKNLLDAQQGYPGPVYPVNPRGGEILGVRCYPDILSVPDPVELAVIIVPAETSADVLEACGQRGIKAAIIISGGFREVGAEGTAREAALLEITRRYGMRLMGPNGIGVIDAHTPLNTTFAAGLVGAGHIDFVSQSGALCGGIIDWAQARGLHFSRFLSIGNKVDVNEVDVLNYLAEDSHSRVIVLYLEDVKDGPGLLAAARRAAPHKPVLALKAGRTASGQTATASHTGALAGAHAAFRAACRQTGMLEFDDIEAMFNAAQALAYQPFPKGRRIAILTNAGGPAVLAADALEPAGLQLAHSSPGTVASLRTFLNPNASVDGPVDMLGAAGEEQYRRALEALLDDPENDGILIILVPMILIDPQAIMNSLVSVLKTSQAGKPVLACLFGEASLEGAYAAADEGDLPAYRFPGQAVAAFSALRQRAAWQQRVEPPHSRMKNVAALEARRLLQAVRREGGKALDADDSRRIVSAYGLKTPLDMLATSADEAARAAMEIGFPVALKLISPDILHKTEVGGVLLNVGDEQAVRAGYESMMRRARSAHPQAMLRGVQVQQMVPAGQEVILGIKRDPVFGPLVMFGLGGVHVEVLGDVAFRLAPLKRLDAEDMISEVRSSALLSGVRGAPPADREALVEAILRVARLAVDFPEVEEMDINPLIVLPVGEGTLAVDARILLSDRAKPDH
jgi:acetyltransferase